jgi:hypothetical protein
METVAGFPVEELKDMGFTSADVEYIREKSLAFKNKIEEPGKVTQTHRPESVKAMVHWPSSKESRLGSQKSEDYRKPRKKLVSDGDKK